MRISLSPARRALLWSVLLYTLLAILLTWPVAARLTTHLAGDPARDNMQFEWNLWWVQEALLGQHVRPAHVTMLHWPDGGTNELLDLSVLIPAAALPSTLLFGPIVSYNLWFLLSFVLVALSGWLLSYYVTGERRAALIGGLIFGFFPHKSLHATGHFLQIMIFLFPLYAIALLRLLRRPSPRNALVAGVTLGLSLLVNLVHVGFFLLPLSALLLLFHLLRDRGWWRTGGPLWLGAMLVTAFFLASPLLLPFLLNSAAGELDHFQKAGTVSFSTDLLALVTPAPDHPLLQNPSFQRWSAFLRKGNLEENVAYLGLTVLVLAAVGVRRARRAALPWLGIALVMVTLALGPFLKVGGAIIGQGSGPEIDGVRSSALLPYAALMKLPFYQWGRIPNRQLMVAMLALSVLAALGIAAFRHRPRRAWLVTGVAALLITLEYLVALPYPTGSAALYDEPVWDELQQEARGAVLSLPQWDFFSFRPSNESLLAATAHGQPIVGGYIHRLPPGSGESAKAIQELVVPPAPLDIVPHRRGVEALHALRALGIATVIVHRDARSPDVWGDADDAAAITQLDEWAGAPRWANERFAVYDLPDEEAGERPALWTLGPGWHGVEGLPDEARRWTMAEAEVWLWLPEARAARLQVDAQGSEPRMLSLLLNGAEVWRGEVGQRALIETGAARAAPGAQPPRAARGRGVPGAQRARPGGGRRALLGAAAAQHRPRAWGVKARVTPSPVAILHSGFTRARGPRSEWALPPYPLRRNPLPPYPLRGRRLPPAACGLPPAIRLLPATVSPVVRSARARGPRPE